MSTPPNKPPAYVSYTFRADDVPAPASPARAKSREGKKGVMFWIDPATFKRLGRIGVDEDRTQQSLMEEALELLFKSRQEPPDYYVIANGPEERAMFEKLLGRE